MPKPKTRTYKRPDQRKVVERVIDNGLDWFEAGNERDPTKRQDYSNAALLILESKVWQNETKRIADLAIRTAAAKAGTMDEINDMRMVVSAIQLLQKRFEEIVNWKARKYAPPEDPHAPI